MILTFDKKSIENQLALLMLVKLFNLSVPNYKETRELICTVKPLIHGQINLIKFIESDKFDNVYCKI